jgi:hypothetical protein
MSESLEILALRKQVLLARSTLCRLRIRREIADIRAHPISRSAALLARVVPLLPLAGVVLNVLRRFKKK